MRRATENYSDIDDDEVRNALKFGKDLIIDSDDEAELNKLKEIERELIFTERRDAFERYVD